MKHLARLLVSVAPLFAIASAGHAQVFNVVLDGPSESPANASPGTGLGTITFIRWQHTMRVQVSFSGLTGGTTASHIHAATLTPFTGTAGVATQTPTFTGFPSGVTSGTYDHTFDTSLASTFRAAFVTANGGTALGAENALIDAAYSGKAYLNIHTTTFGGGEIRGFLVAAPEPTTLSLLGGIALFGAVRRRRIR